MRRKTNHWLRSRRGWYSLLALLGVLAVVLTLGQIVGLWQFGDLSGTATRSGPTTPSPLARVSLNRIGGEGNRDSYAPAVSADGRLVAFLSSADNLVANDNNEVQDLFLYDRATGEMIRLSVSESGEEADGPTTALTMAHDGSKIAFVSTAGNLVPGDTNGVEDVFVYDHKQGALRRVSVDSHGNEALGRSVQPALSADGRFVAFVSLAENLVNADHNDVSDIFVRDLENGVTEIVSVGAGGVPANGTSKFPALSGDGRYVVYQSKAMNLAPTIATPFYQIYRYDRVTGEVLLVSQGVGGGAADGESQRPTVSADGRLVAFESWATNLTDTDTNGFSDVFVFDADRKQTEIISVSSSGEAATGVNGSAVISTDGNFVAFASYADNLADNDRNQHYDIYVRNRSRGETTLVSIAPGQVSGNGNSISPALADKARYVVFDSTATDLVSDDGNSAVDVFIFDRFAGIQLDHIQQLPLITR